MDRQDPPGRRAFLRASGALSAGALFPALAAWAPQAAAQAQDYRALVCVFLYGGNDGNNTVVPYDDYANYAAGRSGATGAAIGRGELVQIAPQGLPRYGLHPNLAPLAPLFDQGKLAVVCNVGTLWRPAHARRLSCRQVPAAQPVLAQRPAADVAGIRCRARPRRQRLGRSRRRRHRARQRGAGDSRHGLAGRRRAVHDRRHVAAGGAVAGRRAGPGGRPLQRRRQGPLCGDDEDPRARPRQPAAGEGRGRDGARAEEQRSAGRCAQHREQHDRRGVRRRQRRRSRTSSISARS